MTPVREQGGDQDIGHAGQEIGFGQDFVMIEDTVKKSGLADQEQEGQHGPAYGDRMETGIQDSQDHPVEIIVFGMQGRHDGMQEQGKLQYQRVKYQYKRVCRGFLFENANHFCLCLGASRRPARNQLLQSKDNFCKDKE